MRAGKAQEAFGAFLSMSAARDSGRSRRGRPARRRGRAAAARGRPVRREGQHQRRGPPLHGRLEDPRGLRRARSRDVRRAARSGGSGRRRQDELRRVRDGLVERELRVRSGPEPVGSGARAGRVVGRVGGVGRGARRAARDRNRHGRLRAAAGRLLRPRGLEADVRPRLALRPHRLRVVLRSGGRPDAVGGRGGARVRRHGGRRPEGLDGARDAGAGRPCGAGSGAPAGRGSAFSRRRRRRKGASMRT